MSTFIIFPNYSLEAIKKRPQLARLQVGTARFVFEISYNRITRGLSLGILDTTGVTRLSTMPITANVNLATFAYQGGFPRNIMIVGSWLSAPDRGLEIAEAFGKEFKLYIQEV